MSAYESPLLQLPGAVAGDGIDAPVAAHYGSLFGEQRTLVSGEGFVDLSHRDVIRVSGPDRLTWLHSLTTQYFEGLQPGVHTAALILSPQGHVEHAMYGVDDGEAFTAHVEPGEGRCARGVARPDALHDARRGRLRHRRGRRHLAAVRWRPRPEVERRAANAASIWAACELIPRAQLATYAQRPGRPAARGPSRRCASPRGEPRLGLDTDHRTIPNEAGWIGSAVHLDKGCYRGQETVARVHTLGRPPRR